MKNHLHPKKDLIFALNFGVHKGNLHTPCSGHIWYVYGYSYMAYACPLESVLYTCILKAINGLR